MDWMQIFSALALIMFIVVLFPRTREMLINSPKGTPSDWLSFFIPLLAGRFLFVPVATASPNASIPIHLSLMIGLPLLS
ncbi:hypothetical protein ABF87_03675, partial [Nitrosomonas sp. JL21]|nr:hypothetical protein [Nitrosomonas sp. JL21]